MKAFYKKKLALLLTVFFFAFNLISIKNAYSDTLFYFPFYGNKADSFVLRSEYKTDFSNSNENRKHNIILSAKLLDGAIVDVNGEFSFNKRIGERSEEKGFRYAKVIIGGKFENGIGGGVCQVSTTLYNAILYAGLKVSEYHPHSLPVNYVPYGFDAMVSYPWADLKFFNDTMTPILIKAKVINDSLVISIYGQRTDEKIVLESIVTEEIMPEEEIIIDQDGEYEFDGKEEIILFSGKKGIKSQSYIYVYEKGKLKSCERARSDTYKAQNKIKVIKGEDNETPDIGIS